MDYLNRLDARDDAAAAAEQEYDGSHNAPLLPELDGDYRTTCPEEAHFWYGLPAIIEVAAVIERLGD